MSRRFIGFSVLLAVGLALLAHGGGQAQEKPAVKEKRTLYVVPQGDAKELATILSKHFDEAVIQAVPGNNSLLIRATPTIADEITKVISELDRRPRLVTIELMVIEATAKADDNALDEKHFTGPQKAVQEKIEALKKKGIVTEMKRFQFTALEGTVVTVSTGESKPYTTGVMAGFRAGGKGGAGGAGVPAPVARNVSFRDVGTQAKVSARVGENKSVALTLDIGDSRMHTPKDAIAIGQDEQGAPIHMPEFVRTTLISKLTIAPGQLVAAKDVQTTSKSGQARTLVLATAKLVEPENAGK